MVIVVVVLKKDSTDVMQRVKKMILALHIRIPLSFQVKCPDTVAAPRTTRA